MEATIEAIIRAIHDDVLGLLHILGHQVGNAELFSRSQVEVVVDGTGNVKNAEMWALRARDLHLENLNSKVLIVDTCSGVYAHEISRGLYFFPH
jgi:hypothetical protein